uniref:Cytochrome P450 monooxygenase okaG n=1 Tax=Penicillium ochrochloron TaxID=69780 RepID=OKAG_PENOH|nr:cytochrome P450 [Penicillium simplicissimum]
MSLISPLAAVLSAMAIVLGLLFFPNMTPQPTLHPRVGWRKEKASTLRAALRSCYKLNDWALEGYNAYAKLNIPYVLPSFDRGPITIIPARLMRRLYTLPDTDLDIRMTQQETNQTRWVAWDKKPAEDTFVWDVLRKQITRNLRQLTPIVASEIELSFNRWWGTDKEWKSIDIWDSCWKIVTGGINTTLCGSPLCRDAEFLQSCQNHSLVLVAGAMAINGAPRLLQPIIGGLVWFVCAILFNTTMKRSKAVVQERLEKTAMLRAEPAYDWKPPQDAIQWIIDDLYASDNLTQLNVKTICFRLLLLNDVSIPSTSFSVQTLLLNLFAADPALGFLEALREECQTVYTESGGVWTYDALKKLKITESAIRESLRLSPVGGIGLHRTVVNPKGISLPDYRLNLPHGTVIASPIESIHYDDDIYPHANDYNAFRFADPEAVRAILDKLSSEPNSNISTGGPRDRESKSAASTANIDEAFLAFGIGKHICPGRFFVMVEMKLILAIILVHYDVKPVKFKPKLVDCLWLKVPWNSGTLVVRRRSN